LTVDQGHRQLSCHVSTAASRKCPADKEAAARRATDAKVIEDAERLIADRNERQARRMPLLFARRSARR
jgi:hypothetical protein